MTLKERAYQAIKEKILSNEYAPGTYLQEVNMAQELNMSRTPIREALLMLENEHLVEIETNKGARVSRIDMMDIIYLSQVRIALETLAIKLAIEKLPVERLQKVKEAFESLMDHSENLNEQELVLMRENGDALHKLIIETAGNPYLITSYQNIMLMLSRMKEESRRAGRQASGLKEHYDIVCALLEKDTVIAMSRMEEHIQTAVADTLVRLQQVLHYP